MKTVIQLTLAATLAGSAVASHHHQHQQFHKKNADKRDEVVYTQVVQGPTETVYVLDGKTIAGPEASQGIDGGDFVVIGESTPTFSPPPPPPPPAPTTSSDLGAQFIESKTSTSSKAPPPPPSTSKAAPPPAHTQSSSNSGSYGASSSGGQGVDTPFPDGKISCDHFPSDYGAVPLDYLGFEGWSGVQQVPDYSFSAKFISNIITAVDQGCTESSMCSYACPDGYQKTQWPAAQGNTGQSIGGLYCGSDNKLYKTAQDKDTLCESGMGGVTVGNALSEAVSICRTDYPGTENMVIPSLSEGGATLTLTNPSQTYYLHEGAKTTAQYYINNKGIHPEIACQWTCPTSHAPEGTCGNWAPIILGTGMDEDGTTYISLFANTPTSTAKLDFNVEITGGSTQCAYRNGAFQGGSDHGCTTAFPKGQSVVVHFH